ncbi:hypothetical protein ACFYWX_08420 [Streptomyces sp. NPDC002888]|uniref:hypothetical protein n=1 Tax=Streptomyces sp. NPDC002888 TaxID=3364668 RepID=UPI003682D7FA
MTTTLETVEDPETSPQDRQGVIESVKQLITALEAIGDEGTPDELRDQLITLVEEVSSTLTVGSDPEVSPEERSLIILVVKRTTSAVPLICDPDTPQELRDRMMATWGQLNDALAEGGGDQTVGWFARQVSATEATAAAPETSPEQTQELAQSAYDQSRSLRAYSAPETSPEGKARAKKDMKDRGARINKQQEDAAADQEQSDASLAEEATVCTSAIFESVADHTLAQGLESLVPDDWDTEGVKDFWKAEEAEDDDELLDVLAQLRNDAHVHGPFEISSLIPQLAEILPRDELFGTLGTPASQCEQTASDLDQDYGVDTGTWLAEAD